MSAEVMKFECAPSGPGWVCPFDIADECVLVEGSPQIIGYGSTPEAARVNLKNKLHQMSQMYAAVARVI